jgi:ABC-2 type transport system ATP-binding protein
VSEVIQAAGLTTWSVSGPDLPPLAEELRKQPGVRQAVSFGNMLHVSGDHEDDLARGIAPFRRDPYVWRRTDAGLEDVFIHLMDRSQQETAS